MQRNQGTIAITGHWEAAKGNKQCYCSLSGGYVIIGTRVPANDQNSTDGYRLQETLNIAVPDYAKSDTRKWIEEVRFPKRSLSHIAHSDLETRWENFGRNRGEGEEGDGVP